MDNTTVIEGTATPVRQLSLSGLLQIPAVRQAGLLVGVALSVALGFAIVLWSQSAQYTQLFSDLGGAEAARVAEALRAADIDYKLNPETGAVMVAQAKLHDARLELASQGLPQGISAGMDMMSEQSSFGVSQFMENARYQHALEAELARTIMHLGAVRDARVHLALPKQTAFIRDRKGVSASVMVRLYSGQELEPDQSSSIVHLVASSVPNLLPGNVTVVDQHGRRLSLGSEHWEDAQTANQFKHVERLEETYRRRIEDLLTPLVGPGRVRAQVVANLDFTVSEETRESFDPASAVVRREFTDVQESRDGSGVAQGIPGALSNQPPQALASAGDAAADATETQEPLNTSRRSDRRFELDRTISRVRPQSGTVRKLSVAVLVDDSPPEGDAASGYQPLGDADIARFEALVKEAVGFDEARGDTVVVVNAAFRAPAEVAAAEPPKIWERPVVRDIGKQVLGACLVLALAFGLVRPMLRSLVSGGGAGGAQILPSGGGSMSAGGVTQLGGGGATAIAGPSFDEKVAAVKNITGHDPARVAQVVKKWVAIDE